MASDLNGGLGRCLVVILIGTPPVATDIFLDFSPELQIYPVLLLGLDQRQSLPNHFDVFIHSITKISFSQNPKIYSIMQSSLRVSVILTFIRQTFQYGHDMCGTEHVMSMY